MSAILGLRSANPYRSVSEQAGSDRHLPVGTAHRTPSPPAETSAGLLTSLRRRITGQGTADEHRVPREQVLRNAFNPNGETFAQRHAAVVVPAACASLALPPLLGTAGGYKLGALLGGGNKNDQIALGAVFGFFGGALGLVASLLAPECGNFDEKTKSLNAHADFIHYLKSASFEDAIGRDRTDAVIRMVTNFFRQTGDHLPTSPDSLESGQAKLLAKPELVGSVQYMAKNHLSALVAFASQPEAATPDHPHTDDQKELLETSKQSSRLLSLQPSNWSDPVPALKKLLTQHISWPEANYPRSGERSAKADFLQTHADTIFSDLFLRPGQIKNLYPYAPAANVRQMQQVDTQGDDCSQEVQHNILNKLDAAFIKRGEESAAESNRKIFAVRDLLASFGSKLADISTVKDINHPHQNALVAAESMIPRPPSGAPQARSVINHNPSAFLKVYRGILESAGIPKATIGELSRELNAQKVIDTLLRPEKMVADVREKHSV